MTPGLKAYASIVATVALLALVPIQFHDSRAMMGVVTGGLLFAAYAVAFNIIFGNTGQLFLCIGALAGLGGYGSVLLSDEAGVPLVLSVVIAGLIAAFVGGLLSWIAVTRSLDVIFTGIVTLAFSLSFQSLLLGRRELTGGESGLRVGAGSDTFLGEQVPPYYAFLALVFAYLVIYQVIQSSRIGWAFRALRDDEVAAELTGIDVTRYRVLAGVIGSAMIGVAGALWALSEGFIGPSTYAFGHVDVRVIVMLSFGGIGSRLGPIIGAVVFTVLDELLVDYSELQVMLYGVVIVALFLGFRRGVIPTLNDALKRRRTLRSSPA